MAFVLLFIITAYQMSNNKWANYINQTLAGIKLITYLTIALVGLGRLIADPKSRLNWRQSLGGEADFTAYSTSILLVKI